MFKFVVFAALVAVAYGGVVGFESPLGATLLPKVNIAPTKLTVVKQPITVEQTETVYRSVPVPVRAVSYSAPQVHTPLVHSVAAPALVAPHLSYSHLIAGHHQLVL